MAAEEVTASHIGSTRNWHKAGVRHRGQQAQRNTDLEGLGAGHVEVVGEGVHVGGGVVGSHLLQEGRQVVEQIRLPIAAARKVMPGNVGVSVAVTL